MIHRFLHHRPAFWLATCALLLLGGCATLQVDVDVYKGPLAHEPEIQVRQYASMAISAKPLLQNLLCTEEKAELAKLLPAAPAEDDHPVSDALSLAPAARLAVDSCNAIDLTKACPEYENFKSQFLCEVLDLYRSKGDKKDAKNLNVTSGLEQLTEGVTAAMAQFSYDTGHKKEMDLRVNALSDALIFFAQKMLYITNNELLYGVQPNEKDQQDSPIAVLQSLGNTILVHANDLRRQTNTSLAQKQNAGSENNAVQQAFEPEASVTMQMIIARLKNFSTNAPTADADKFVSNATPEQLDELARLGKQAETYQTVVAPLLATLRTISNEPPEPLKTLVLTDVDILSANQDRITIARLFPANKPVDADAPPLKPLLDWLDRELASGVVISPTRPDRLRNVKAYVTTEADRLAAFGIRSTTDQSATLAALKQYIKSQVVLATAHVGGFVNQSATLQKTIDKQDQEAKGRIGQAAADAKAKTEQEKRDKMVLVVESVSAAVVAEAEQLKVRDSQVILGLLRRKLDGLGQPDSQTKLAAADIKLTRTAIEYFNFPQSPCRAVGNITHCEPATSIEVLDNLIASLRAKRLQAIASGSTQAAKDLLAAINVAYEQRTSMIYLRPASDYLRSVYSSNQLTDNIENEERNMLVDWFKKYLNPAESDTKNYARSQLEKMHWQSVNKVTVTGGGNTNYVLAKDDVGNWYVKAYGSDPEAIIRSATSLALFNSGKSIDVNLLRRFELQRKLDEDDTLSDAQRGTLKDELDANSRQGGALLLKLRFRYAERYRRDTGAQASALLAVMNELPAKSTAVIAKSGDWPVSTVCTPAAVDALLKPLESKYLETPTARLLKATTTPVDSTEAANQLEETEKSIQAALTAMYLYSADAQRTLLQARIDDCVDAQGRSATLVRSHARAQVAAVAAERKLSIERYEDALSSVLEIAAEK